MYRKRRLNTQLKGLSTVCKISTISNDEVFGEDGSKRESLNCPTFKQDVASSFLIVDWTESKTTLFKTRVIDGGVYSRREKCA
jgi:hypothetical protein